MSILPNFSEFGFVLNEKLVLPFCFFPPLVLVLRCGVSMAFQKCRLLSVFVPYQYYYFSIMTQLFLFLTHHFLVLKPLLFFKQFS